MATDLAVKPYDVVCTTDDREAWLKARRPFLGASEMASVLGLSPWRPAVDVWAQKTSRVEESPDDMSESMELGLRLEPFLLQELRDRSGCPVERSSVLLRSKLYPHLGATQDGSVAPLEGTPLGRSVPMFVGMAGTVEVKTAGGGFAEQWEQKDGYRGVALVPAWYLPQVDCQLAVTGAPFAVFAVLMGGRGFRFRWTVVERNESRIEELAERTGKWWQDHVIADIPPEPDGSEAANDLIARLYPDAQGTIALHEEHVSDVAAIKLAGERIKELETAREVHRQRLKMFLGGAEVGTLPDGRVVTYKTVKRKGYEVQPSESRVLRMPKEG